MAANNENIIVAKNNRHQAAIEKLHGGAAYSLSKHLKIRRNLGQRKVTVAGSMGQRQAASCRRRRRKRMQQRRKTSAAAKSVAASAEKYQ